MTTPNISPECAELALELFVADNFKQPRQRSVEDWNWYKDTGRLVGHVVHYETMAAACLAAGYRKIEAGE